VVHPAHAGNWGESDWLLVLLNFGAAVFLLLFRNVKA